MDILATVINTLNSIEVHGKDNLSKLLGCIEVLEKIAQEAEEKDG